MTIDARVLAEVGGERVAWDRVRLRPFTRMSARLAGHLEALVQSIQLDPIGCVVANLRSLLVDVASELVEGEGHHDVAALLREDGATLLDPSP